MTDDLRFERNARDWLEFGPVEAPFDVVQAALLEIDSTPQERDVRVPWRLQAMPTFARALVAAAVIIGLAAGGALFLQRSNEALVGGPSPSPRITAPAPSPSAAPSPLGLEATPLSATFASDRYGYSVAIAPDWPTQQATLTWTGPDNSPPTMDEIFVSGEDIRFDAGSQALRPGETFAQWLEMFQPPYLANLYCLGGPPSSWPTRQIAGRSWLWQQTCWAASAIADVDGRAYVFTCETCLDVADANTQLFDRMLASVRFDPSAIPSPGPVPALEARFESAQNGFAVKYPGGWTVHRATAPAVANDLPVGSASWDTLGDETQRLLVTSVALPRGESAAEWARAFCEFSRTGWSPPCADAPGSWEKVLIGSDAGWLTVNGDGASMFPVRNSRLFEAAVVKGGRAYEIRLEGPAERELFLALLASMALDPASAVDKTP